MIIFVLRRRCQDQPCCPKRRPLLQYLTTSIAYHYVRHGVRNRLDQEGKSKYHRCTYGTQKTKRFFFRFVRTVEFSSYLFPYEDEFCRDTKRTNLFQSCRWFLRPSRDTPRTQPERTERTWTVLMSSSKDDVRLGQDWKGGFTTVTYISLANCQ